MIFRLSPVGPLTLMKTGPRKCVSSHFSKCLDPDYCKYQAKCGAFIQTELKSYVYNDTCSTNLDLNLH